MNPNNEVRPWQFSLRSFLVVVLIVGPIAVVVGPIILEAITEWKPPPQQMPSRKIPRPRAASTEPDGYYESGETPLN
jgi:hypothetical protein